MSPIQLGELLFVLPRGILRHCAEDKKAGRIALDDDGKRPVFVVEHGGYTCYHIAHHNAWTKYPYERDQAIAKELQAYVVLPSTSKKSKPKLELIIHAALGLIWGA